MPAETPENGACRLRWDRGGLSGLASHTPDLAWGDFRELEASRTAALGQAGEETTDPHCLQAPTLLWCP